LSPQFEAAVFEAAPGEFTPILPLPGGAVFAQVIRITPERYLSYEEARADAAEFARRRATRFSIERALRFVSPFEQTSDTRTWDRRPLDHVMVQAGDLSLTKAEFLQIFPEVEMSRFELDGGILELQAKALALGGHARRLAIEAGLAGDPLVIDTRRHAEAVIRSRRALAQRWAGLLPPPADQVSVALASTPQRFTSAPRYHVMWVSAEIAPQTPTGLRDELARLLVEDFIAAAREQAAAEGYDPAQPDPEFEGFRRAGAATGLRPEPAPREGDPVPTELTEVRRQFPYERLLPWFRNEESAIVVNDLGWLYLDDIPVLRDAVADLPVGEFTALHTLGGKTGAWIVVDIQEGRPLPPAQAQLLASRELAVAMRAEAVQALLENEAGSNRLEVLLD
jgi:hypothetical protein